MGDPSPQRGRRQRRGHGCQHGASWCPVPVEGGLWQRLMADKLEKWCPHSALGVMSPAAPREWTAACYCASPWTSVLTASAPPRGLCPQGKLLDSGARLQNPGPLGSCWVTAAVAGTFLQLGAARLDVKQEDYEQVLT